MLEGRDGESVFKSTFKVMVVDPNKEFPNNVSDLLESRSFEVTWVEDVGAALRLLALKKDKFDLLLIDSDLRDVDVATFLRLTKDMNILSMVMREEADDNYLLKMFKNGAFLVVNRPLTDDSVFQARQHVIRQRIHKLKENKMFHESNETESESSGDRKKNNYDSRKNIRKRYNTENSDIQQLDDESSSSKKKIYLEWTEELHDKFLRAVHKLGEGNCLPRAIVDAMGVPGLTRMQVASHLQKCREDGWVFNAKRGQPKDITFSSDVSQLLGFRRFGRMPRVATRHVDNQEERNNTHIDATTYSSNRVCMDLNHINNKSSHDSSLMNGFEFQNSSVQGCDFSLMNGFGLQNSRQVLFATSAAKSCDSSLMNGFGLQNNGQVFSLPSFGKGCDSSLMNGFELENRGQLFSVSNDGQGSSSNIFTPNEASDNFFDFWNDIDGNNILSCMQSSVLGTNYDSISEQSYTYYDQVIPNQGTCTNEISQEVGGGNV